jgi:hypothetical protein
MILKFNNGNGALLCQHCKVIVMDNFVDYEWKALCNLNDQNNEWFCKDCDPKIQRQQDQLFVDEVNKIAEKYSSNRRNYLKTKYFSY